MFNDDFLIAQTGLRGIRCAPQGNSGDSPKDQSFHFPIFPLGVLKSSTLYAIFHGFLHKTRARVRDDFIRVFASRK